MPSVRARAHAPLRRLVEFAKPELIFELLEHVCRFVLVVATVLLLPVIIAVVLASCCVGGQRLVLPLTRFATITIRGIVSDALCTLSELQIVEVLFPTAAARDIGHVVASFIFVVLIRLAELHLLLEFDSIVDLLEHVHTAILLVREHHPAIEIERRLANDIGHENVRVPELNVQARELGLLQGQGRLREGANA